MVLRRTHLGLMFEDIMDYFNTNRVIFSANKLEEKIDVLYKQNAYLLHYVLGGQ